MEQESFIGLSTFQRFFKGERGVYLTGAAGVFVIKLPRPSRPNKIMSPRHFKLLPCLPTQPTINLVEHAEIKELKLDVPICWPVIAALSQETGEKAALQIAQKSFGCITFDLPLTGAAAKASKLKVSSVSQVGVIPSPTCQFLGHRSRKLALPAKGANCF